MILGVRIIIEINVRKFMLIKKIFLLIIPKFSTKEELLSRIAQPVSTGQVPL